MAFSPLLSRHQTHIERVTTLDSIKSIQTCMVHVHMRICRCCCCWPCRSLWSLNWGGGASVSRINIHNKSWRCAIGGLIFPIAEQNRNRLGLVVRNKKNQHAIISAVPAASVLFRSFHTQDAPYLLRSASLPAGSPFKSSPRQCTSSYVHITIIVFLQQQQLAL